MKSIVGIMLRDNVCAILLCVVCLSSAIEDMLTPYPSSLMTHITTALIWLIAPVSLLQATLILVDGGA